MRMVKYACDICNFGTNSLFNYNRHIKTMKHIQKTSNHRNTGIIKKIKTESHMCQYCQKNFSKSCNLARHNRMCSNKAITLGSYEDNISKIKEECKDKIMMKNIIISKKDDQIALLKDQIHSYKSVIDSAGNIAKSSVSAITYLIQHHNNAPPLKQITNDECKKIKYNACSNNTFVDELVDYYYDKTLVAHIGDFIVNTYKKDDVNKQSIWNSDTTRLTYIIRRSIDENKTDWTMDKKGNNTCEYIIEPVIEYVKECINESYDQLSRENVSDDVHVDQMESNLKKMMYMVQILRLIKKNVLRDEILKYIAPKFYLHK